MDASSDASVDAADGSVGAGLDGSSSADAYPPPSPVDAGGCPALTYPSGVVIQTFLDAAMTATYADHLGTGELAPTCFLDADNLLNPQTGDEQLACDDGFTVAYLESGTHLHVDQNPAYATCVIE
jgi:hypothetical protein